MKQQQQYQLKMLKEQRTRCYCLAAGVSWAALWLLAGSMLPLSLAMQALRFSDAGQGVKWQDRLLLCHPTLPAVALCCCRDKTSGTAVTPTSLLPAAVQLRGVPAAGRQQWPGGTAAEEDGGPDQGQDGSRGGRGQR